MEFEKFTAHTISCYNCLSSKNMSLADDPIIRAIYREIKEPIDVLIEKKYYRASLILIFSGIDAVANIGRPKDAAENTPEDFKAWVKRYLTLKGAPVEPTPDDWWSARNGYLHTQSAFSRDTERQRAKYIIFAYGKAPIWHNPSVPDMLVVGIEAMRDAFYKGIDDFLIQQYAGGNTDHHAMIEERIRKMSINMSMEELHRKHGELPK
jgi:hypothetical protein